MLFALKKGDPTICNNMDEHGRHYTKWNKVDTKELHDLTYMWNLKRVKYMEAKSRTVVSKGREVGEIFVKVYKVGVK